MPGATINRTLVRHRGGGAVLNAVAAPIIVLTRLPAIGACTVSDAPAGGNCCVALA